jgi:hypothetical protein
MPQDYTNFGPPTNNWSGIYKSDWTESIVKYVGKKSISFATLSPNPKTGEQVRFGFVIKDNQKVLKELGVPI